MTRPDKSPLALTTEMAAALRLIAMTPLLDTPGILQGCSATPDTVDQLVRRGLVKTQASSKRDGKKTSLYCTTLKGMLALDRHTPAQRASLAVIPGRMSSVYVCPEMGRTCHRPGAYDAFSLPSLFGSERRMPKGGS